MTNTNLEGIIAAMGPVTVSVTHILAAFALLGFFWGVSLFIWNSGNEKKREQGRYVMLWGVIALFVLVSISGLLGVLQSTFSLSDNPTIVPPSATPPSQFNTGI